MFGGRGKDEFFGGLGNDVERGGRGRDVIEMAFGDDIVGGGRGRDRLFAFSSRLVGPLVINLATGRASSIFGLNDRINQFEDVDVGWDDAVTVIGTDQPNKVAVGPGPVLVHGRGGDDRIRTTLGNDTVFGGPGDDSLRTGDGNDALDGGPGNDELHGGRGTDTCMSGETLFSCP